MDLWPGKRSRRETNRRAVEEDSEVDLVSSGQDSYDRYQNEMCEYMKRLEMSRHGGGYVEPVETETETTYARQQSAPRNYHFR